MKLFLPIFVFVSSFYEISLSFHLTTHTLVNKSYSRSAQFATMIELPNDGDFEQEVLKSSEPVIVDFYANWCGPCKLVAPIFKQLASEVPEGIKFVKVDTEVHESTVDMFDIQGLPLFGVFVDGIMVASHSGALSKNPMKQLIRKGLTKVVEASPKPAFAALIEALKEE